VGDLVDKVCEQWGQVKPDLDTSGMAVVSRVLRVASLLRRMSEDLLAEYGLNRAEFDVLCAVRRNHALSPGQITREMLSSGAAVTKRVDRLESLGLVVREKGERDRRVVRVRITEQGIALLDELLPRQLGAERVALDGFSPKQRDQLAGLLSTMLETVEGHAAG
jgi:DNA-binding MarR family transcriptional regulator